MNLIEYPDTDMLMIALADRIAGDLRQALSQKDKVSLAVPGGTTPGPVFDHLCATDLDWARVAVMLTDERWVPEGSGRSNTRLIRERLLTGRAAKARLVPLFDKPSIPPKRGWTRLRRGSRRACRWTCSCWAWGRTCTSPRSFRGQTRLHDALHGDALLVPMRAPGAPEPRVTLSAAVLRGAMSSIS